jgi:hypothetical protein
MTTDKIQITFNRQQFDVLVRIFSLGKWMLEAHEDDFDTKFKKERELEQFLFAHSKSDLLEFSGESGGFIPSDRLEDEVETIVSKYDSYVFWDELAHNLAERDLEIELGKKANEMTIEELLLGEERHLNKYLNEFVRNGLKNFTIKSD